MTPEQYWDGDPSLTKYYRQAHELQRKRRNEDMWLQGMYIYEALCDVSPILHAFAKKGAKPHPFTDKPYSITKEDREEERRRQEQIDRDKARRYMEGKMAKINKMFNG
jgi:hypothetical protein